MVEPILSPPRRTGCWFLDARNARKKILKQTVRRLQAVRVSVLGTVMNNTKQNKGRYYSYAYKEYE